MKEMKLRDNMILVKVNTTIIEPPAGFKLENDEPLKNVIEVHKEVIKEMGFFGIAPEEVHPVAYIIHVKGTLDGEPAIFSINFILNAKGFVEYEISPVEWDSLLDLGDFNVDETVMALYERVVQGLKEHKGTVKSVLGHGVYMELQFPPGSGLVIGGGPDEPEFIGTGLIHWSSRIEPSEWGLD